MRQGKLHDFYLTFQCNFYTGRTGRPLNCPWEATRAAGPPLRKKDPKIHDTTLKVPLTHIIHHTDNNGETEVSEGSRPRKKRASAKQSRPKASRSAPAAAARASKNLVEKSLVLLPSVAWKFTSAISFDLVLISSIITKKNWPISTWKIRPMPIIKIRQRRIRRGRRWEIYRPCCQRYRTIAWWAAPQQFH